MIAIQNLEKMLTETEKELHSVTEQLAQCPAGTLMVSKGPARYDLFQVTYQDGKRNRRSIKKEHMLVMALARKRYLEAEQTLLIENRNVLQKACKNFCETSPEQIFLNMPQVYTELPRAYYFDTSATEDPDLTVGGKAGAAWAQAPFQQSNYRPEGRIHLTSRGLAVRSKSEMLIAEKLYAYHVPFRYEQVLVINSRTFAPDFTIRRKDGSLHYWEHCGLMSNETYRKRHKWKLDIYESAGIVPWENLTVTYDNTSGKVNLAVIESEIRNKLL